MYFIMTHWPDKPRIVCLHLEEALETVYEKMKLDTYKKRNLLYLILFQFESLARINHVVLCYVFVKLSRNPEVMGQTFVFCLMRLDPRLDSRFLQESRIKNQARIDTDNRLSTYF